MAFFIFIAFILFLRMTELSLSKRNEKWLVQNHAIEYGNEHYRFIVMLHVLFFLSLIFEYMVNPYAKLNLLFLILYIILLAFKVCTIFSLGKFWNTKIYRIPNAPLVKKGPYKYFKHPNYMIVIGEIAIIPLVFHLYFTAVIFTILNGIMLSVRIKEENKALHN